MHYRTLTSVITFALLGLVILLFIFPTAALFVIASALVPVLIGVLAVGVLRAPVQPEERQQDSPWYDQH